MPPEQEIREQVSDLLNGADAYTRFTTWLSRHTDDDFESYNPLLCPLSLYIGDRIPDVCILVGGEGVDFSLFYMNEITEIKPLMKLPTWAQQVISVSDSVVIKNGPTKNAFTGKDLWEALTYV